MCTVVHVMPSALQDPVWASGPVLSSGLSFELFGTLSPHSDLAGVRFWALRPCLWEAGLQPGAHDTRRGCVIRGLYRPQHFTPLCVDQFRRKSSELGCHFSLNLHKYPLSIPSHVTSNFTLGLAMQNLQEMPALKIQSFESSAVRIETAYTKWWLDAIWVCKRMQKTDLYFCHRGMNNIWRNSLQRH